MKIKSANNLSIKIVSFLITTLSFFVFFVYPAYAEVPGTGNQAGANSSNYPAGEGYQADGSNTYPAGRGYEAQDRHHKESSHNKFSFSVNIPGVNNNSMPFPQPDNDPGYEFEHHHRHHPHHRGVEWLDSRLGEPLPRGAVVGGKQFNPYAALYVCRGNYGSGVHPGKLYAGKCNIGWGGDEISLSRYQVLVSDYPLDWMPAKYGNIPFRAVQGGYENGQSLYVCQGHYRGGNHPGKVVGNMCNIGWGGKEIQVANFNVLVS